MQGFGFAGVIIEYNINRYMRPYMRVIFIFATLLISACSSTQGLSVFSFSNTDLESVITKQLPQLSKNVTLMGLPVKFDVSDVNVDIGPENRDVIALGLNSNAEVNAFAFKYPVGLKLQIEGSPYYDSEKKAIFLKDVKLLDSTIDAGGFTGNLNVLSNEALSIINAFLAVNPVYTLNTNDPKMALLGKLPLDIKVLNGAINIVPKL